MRIASSGDAKTIVMAVIGVVVDRCSDRRPSNPFPLRNMMEQRMPGPTTDSFVKAMRIFEMGM
jgi:hypothetical protein